MMIINATSTSHLWKTTTNHPFLMTDLQELETEGHVVPCSRIIMFSSLGGHSRAKPLEGLWP